jgi:transglutaminase-like putative cysteine protease
MVPPPVVRTFTLSLVITRVGELVVTVEVVLPEVEPPEDEPPLELPPEVLPPLELLPPVEPPVLPVEPPVLVVVLVVVLVFVGAVTVSETLLVAEPPVPVQVRVYVFMPVVVWAPVLSLPEVLLVPVHEPLAEQVVAFVLLHERVVAEPVVRVVAAIERVTVGTGAGVVVIGVPISQCFFMVLSGSPKVVLLQAAVLVKVPT